MFCIYCDVIICLYNHNDDVISTHFTQEAKKDLIVQRMCSGSLLKPVEDTDTAPSLHACSRTSNDRR